MLTTLRQISVKYPSSKPRKPADRSKSQAADLRPADQGTPTPSAPGEVASGVEIPKDATVHHPKSDSGSTTSSQNFKQEGSENGTETEEDEGMVLVGRPP